MHILTQTGCVKEDTTHRFSIQLPPNSRLLVTAEQTVQADTPLAIAGGAVRRLRLPVAIGSIASLRKQVGDAVRAGETLAVTTSHMGLGLTEYVSAADGIIEAIDERYLLLRSAPRTIKAQLSGEIVDLTQPGRIELSAQGDLLRGWAGSGGPCSGTLHLVGDLFHPTQLREHITHKLEGAVVVSTSSVLGEALPMLVTCGAVALIAPSVAWSNWACFTAAAKQLTVITTEPFGTPSLPSVKRAILARGHQRLVYACGGRAGVQPPEVFIPREAAPARECETSLPCLRVLTGPFMGQEATLTSSTLRWMDTALGYRELAAYIRVDSGEEAWTPLCNLEKTVGGRIEWEVPLDAREEGSTAWAGDQLLRTLS